MFYIIDVLVILDTSESLISNSLVLIGLQSAETTMSYKYFREPLSELQDACPQCVTQPHMMLGCAEAKTVFFKKILRH